MPLARFLIAVFVLAMVSVASASDQPPNVVVIFCDDMGYADIGPFGAEVDTPNLDRMAAEGRVFTDFYAAQAVCSASRAALLTGCYPNRIGVRGAYGPKSQNGLNPNETTIAEILKPLGYATAIYGKWHLGDEPIFYPTNHGFDEYFGLPYSNDMWPLHPAVVSAPPGSKAKSRYPDLPLWAGKIVEPKTATEEPTPDERRQNRQVIHMIVDAKVTAEDQAQLTTQYTEHAVDFINRHHDEPFFLYVPQSMVHVPLFVSDKFKGKSGHGLFGDVVQEIDWSVGQILGALREHELVENTLVVFTSDNGPWLSYGNYAGSAGPLREGKGTAWEGGQREPTIMWWPGRIPAGTTCSEPCGTIDLLPTIAAITGAELPETEIDGLDITSLMFKKNAESPHEALYFYWGNALHAIRSGDWKLHFPHSYRSLDGRPGGRDGTPAKYEQLRTDLALYNLAKDIGETHNVAAEHPEVVARLKKLADEMRAELGDSLAKTKGTENRPVGHVGEKR